MADYSSETLVKEILPGTLPAALTSTAIARFITRRSEYDDCLRCIYTVPFAAYTTSGTSCPAQVEDITTKLAAHDCMVFMGLMNAEDASSMWKDDAQASLAQLMPKRDSSGRITSDPSVTLNTYIKPDPMQLIQIVTGNEGEQNEIWWEDP